MGAWFDRNNRLTIAGAVHDPAGNQQQIGGYTNIYDAENRMTSSAINGVTTSYSYDGEGRRVTKTTGANTVTYVYDAAGELAAEYGGTAGAPCATCYLASDHLGSTRMVRDGATGHTVAFHDYLPFGQEIPAGVGGRDSRYVIADALAQKFTAKERDTETGLDWFEMRYFSAAQARFTSPDAPLIGQDRNDPQTWNLYSYARNNPLRYVDPTGHEPEPAGTDDANCGRNLKDCGPTIGPLPLTSSFGQTQDRGIGILQGFAITGLDLLELLPGNHDTLEDLKSKVGPSSQNQQFGQDLGGILAVLIPVGGATKEVKIATKTFEEARNVAIKIVGEIDPATRRETIGKSVR